MRRGVVVVVLVGRVGGVGGGSGREGEGMVRLAGVLGLLMEVVRW